MGENAVLSLCDRTGNMVQPWAEAGYDCYAVDTEHDGRTTEHVGDGTITYVEADVREYLPPRREYAFACGFPPCTNLAVSGARWFKDKGLDGLSDGIELVERCVEIVQWTESSWMIENPVSTLSTYWRDPDHTFHPYEYSEYSDVDDAYSKKTCLWTGNGFEMPETDAVDEYDERIHQKMSSNKERSKTPQGFANAVFEANH